MTDFRYYAGMDSSAFLAHYGKGHLDGGNSGRYKLGSGKRPRQALEYDRGDDSNKPASRVSSRGEAKKSVKRLNKLDKQLAEARYQKYKSSQDYAKASKKFDDRFNKIQSKNPGPYRESDYIDDRTIKSSNRKMSDAEDRMKASDHDIKAIQSEMDDIVKTLTDSGYDISTEATKRAVEKGKTAALNALGAIGAMTLGVGVFSTNKKMIGTKYKLKDTESAKEQREADYDGDEYDENMANQLNAHKGRYPWGNDSNEKYGGIFNRKKAEKYDYQAEEAKRQKQLDEAIERYSKGNDAEKAWVKVLEIDKKKDSYKTEEEYERDRGKALDAYETVFKNTSPAYKAHEKHKQFVNKSQKNRLTGSQQERFDRAKSKDLWDMEFLEMYQPEEKWETSQALREYKAYLLDPEEWKKGR